MNEQTVTQAPMAVKWVVVEGIDLAAQWGHEDANEGKRRGGEMFTFLSPEYHSYHGAYSAGLRQLHQLTGTVCQAALDECSWFDEISGAKPPVVRLTAEQIEEIETEHIGADFCENPNQY